MEEGKGKREGEGGGGKERKTPGAGLLHYTKRETTDRDRLQRPTGLVVNSLESLAFLSGFSPLFCNSFSASYCSSLPASLCMVVTSREGGQISGIPFRF